VFECEPLTGLETSPILPGPTMRTALIPKPGPRLPYPLRPPPLIQVSSWFPIATR
jgi:hypothetical protein